MASTYSFNLSASQAGALAEIITLRLVVRVHFRGVGRFLASFFNFCHLLVVHHIIFPAALQAKSAVSAAARRTRRRPPGVGRACWAAIAASCCAPQAAPMAAPASSGQQATLRPMACTPGGLPPAASWWLLRNTSQKALSRRVYAPLRCAQTLREKSPFLRSVASQSLLAAPGLRLAGVRSLARLGVPKARRARPGCGCAAAALPAGGARSLRRRRGARALPALISAPLQTTPGHIDRGKRIAWGMISPGRQASGPPAGDAGGCVCGRSA